MPLSSEGDVQVTIDTSAVMAVLLGEGSRDRLLEVTQGADLQSAPTLPWEVGNALSALFRRDRIDLTVARAALQSLERIPLRLPDVELEAAVELARDHGIYAYDAYILECARRYRTPLLSLDVEQCAVARRMGVDLIEVPP